METGSPAAVKHASVHVGLERAVCGTAGRVEQGAGGHQHAGAAAEGAEPFKLLVDGCGGAEHASGQERQAGQARGQRVRRTGSPALPF